MYLIGDSSIKLFYKTINDLDKKYQDYLANDGKWLGGGFQNLFCVLPIPGSKNYQLNLKPEVFMQLPRTLRKEISGLVFMDG
ncbi:MULTISPECIES: hypothetical protein [Sphingobacterium]|uniref:hypothetical protein n=1 Tax=Sphingobacterium TaxID=28453 RepID=UPI00289DE4EF|nr:hypothetical protein [Sphingobacterium mizutaii]